MRAEIDRYGINGEGIGKLPSGKLVFVRNAMPNEIVDINIIQENSKFANGEVNIIEKSSPDRISPQCDHYGVCGGCDLQHISKFTQIEIKKKSVIDTIKKVAKLDINIDNFIYGKDFYYRNKMVFPVGTKEGHAYIGMFKECSNKVIPINKCILAQESIDNVLELLRGYIEDNFHGFDFESNEGDIKYLVIRECGGTVLVTFVVTKNVDLIGANEILCKHIKNYGISTIISNSKTEILSGKYQHLFGKKYMEIEEKSIDYRLDNRGFLQVNDEIKEQLYDKVLSYIETGDKVLDCYSGAGLLTAIISKVSKSISGIEINSSACDSARTLIEKNNLKNITYHEGDVKKILPKVISDENVVVLDPARSGCDKSVLETINKSKVVRVIYISCNPSTLARDLCKLKENFEIKEFSLFEMFPNTKHIESLVLLNRKN